MSWSLEIRNGDLTAAGARLGTVTGTRKMIQDLSHWILEPMGTDNLHPGYGSLIDGGITAEGEQQESLIGSTDIDYVTTEVDSEVVRIAKEYQSLQLERVKNDRFTYNKPTLTAQEILFSLVGITYTQVQDLLQVVIGVQTGSGEGIDLSLPLESKT